MTSLVTSEQQHHRLVAREIHRTTFNILRNQNTPHNTTAGFIACNASQPDLVLSPLLRAPGRHIPDLPPFHISTFPLSCEICKALLAMILLFFPNQLVSEAPTTRDRQQQQQQQATNSEGVFIGFFCILFFGTFGKEEAPALFEPFCLLLYYFFLILQVRYQYITYPPQSSIAIS
jgi:hypothetical protein